MTLKEDPGTAVPYRPTGPLEETEEKPSRVSSVASLNSVRTQRDKGRNRGWLLSGLLAINVLILGSAIVTGSAYNKVELNAVDLQSFLTFLLIVTTVWIVYYMVYTSREDRAVLFKDGHAGPVWLRCGLVLFGVCSLVMDVFKIGTFSGLLQCESTIKVIFPAVQAVFIIVQTYFLWVHAKDCVQLQKKITQCGLILTLSTNLILWMSTVTEESQHHVEGLANSSHGTPEQNHTPKASHETDRCECSHSACGTFEKIYFYLYPFNIEYSLFASAMVYVMWRNVGRQADHHQPHHASFRLRDVLVGPMAGLVLLAAGVVTFVVYEIDMYAGEQARRDKALATHYVTNAVVLALMSVCSAVGCAVYCLDERDHVVGKNPTRSLDVGLLLAASMGQLTVSYFTIVAAVAMGAASDALNLACSALMVVQLSLQNVFIIEGLRREKLHDTFTWKRRALKEICAFLILCNVLLWIMPAFGARPQFDSPLGTKFYQFIVWAAVVNIGLPFGIFYRMHAVGSLFEILVTS